MKRHYTSRSKALLLFLLLAVAGVAKAQTHEFAPIGAEWHYGRQTMFTWGYIRIFVTNDTIIDGHVCSVLQKEEHGFNYYSQALYHFNLGREYFTQIKDSVLVYRKGRFYKLFDFGSSIGDTWTVVGREDVCEENFGRVHVVGKGTETINGIDLRYVLVVDDVHSYWGYGHTMYGEPPVYPNDTVKIIECIGPIGSYLLPRQRCLFDYMEGGDLRCYSDDKLGYLNYDPERFCDYINEEYQGIEELSSGNELQVFPNPCNNFLTVVLPKKDQYVVTIYDNFGKIVARRNIHENLIELDLTGFCPGFYYLTANNGFSNFSTMIIKKQSL
ncbi:T9SS type A sorting domain-containing protein [Bacteroides heparinolyticus]|uniref:T9SS type A sorting domain-containing protein n=1 Tax=Prevotella heparinolytica TaxID=28113 RepID=UPI0035A02C7B